MGALLLCSYIIVKLVHVIKGERVDVIGRVYVSVTNYIWALAHVVVQK
jgi:hypothetical protein